MRIALHDPDSEGRIGALELLEDMEDPRARAAARTLIKDPDPSVRQQAE